MGWQPLAGRTSKKKRQNLFFPKHTLVGLVFDAIDWFIVGMIPIMGDIIDALATAYWLKVIGPAGLAAAVEFIPLSDVLPVHIALGLYADYNRMKKR